MKIIRPTAITDAMLVSSDVPEDDYAAYNGGTTYALGANVISTTTHRIYESLQSGNVGHALPVPPETQTDWWLDVGATNRWAMFDQIVQTQTVNEDQIEVVLRPGRIDAIALLNIDAASYRVQVTSGLSSPDEVVYDSGTVALEEQKNITDWYEYFFEPTSIRTADVVLTDLPPYTNGTVIVTLSAPTADVKLGVLIVGLARDIGEMAWAPNVGINDYSVKTVDAFGSATVTERAFSKRMSCEVKVENDAVDFVLRTLSGYRAVPLVWIGDETQTFTSTIVYGFFKSFDIVIASPAFSLCNLELEGLT